MDDEDIVVVSMASKNSLANTWILDSTCISYYTTHKDWFQSYKVCNASSVVLGDNHFCKAGGIWTIRIKMFDAIMRTLEYVKNMSKLKKKRAKFC